VTTVEMLTAKEMQALLQVDRLTIYRMAAAKRLPQVQRIADILAHIVTERAALIGKLTTIAELVKR